MQFLESKPVMNWSDRAEDEEETELEFKHLVDSYCLI